VKIKNLAGAVATTAILFNVGAVPPAATAAAVPRAAAATWILAAVPASPPATLAAKHSISYAAGLTAILESYLVDLPYPRLWFGTPRPRVMAAVE
jgi:hypothetical protein